MKYVALLLCAAVAHGQLASPPDAEDTEPAPDVVSVQLRAAVQQGDDFRYAYNGLNPGPVIRARVGDTLVVTLTNGLDAPTTLHWHGLAVPWEMDGVTWMAEPVGPGEERVYTFPVQRPGTFWYHPHFDTERQVDAGLYGMLIVEDPADPPAPELLLVFDTAAEHRDPFPRHGHGRATRAPRWLVNGQPTPATWSGDAGENNRVRVLNASNVGYLAVEWPGLYQIAGKQGLLPAPRSPERVVLAPGQRAEFEWRLAERFTVSTAPYSLNGGAAHGEPLPLLDVEIDGEAPAPEALAWPFDGTAPSADVPHTDLLYALAGSDRTGDWRINGERFPDVTVHEVDHGAEVVFEVRNLSPTEHPFHLHGHHFEVLSVNGEPPRDRTIADTWNLRIRDTLRARFIADNPGDWMAHCHLLPHVGEGMMTVVRVRAP